MIAHLRLAFTILLWRSVSYPLVLYVNTWSMLYFALQTHLSDQRLSSHPYLNKTASKTLHCIYVNLSSFNGKDDNDIEEPSDVAISWLLIVQGSFFFGSF